MLNQELESNLPETKLYNQLASRIQAWGFDTWQLDEYASDFMMDGTAETYAQALVMAYNYLVAIMVTNQLWQTYKG